MFSLVVVVVVVFINIVVVNEDDVFSKLEVIAIESKIVDVIFVLVGVVAVGGGSKMPDDDVQSTQSIEPFCL